MAQKLVVNYDDVVRALGAWLKECNVKELSQVFEIAFDGSILEDVEQMGDGKNIYHIHPSGDIFDIVLDSDNEIRDLFHNSKAVEN